MKCIANPVEVDAFEILEVGPEQGAGDFATRELKLKDREGVYVATPGMMSRYAPVVGDYWVVQADGYIYLNPKDVFERKYRPQQDKGRMPVSKYFKGDGDKVMASMKKRYGSEGGKRVFYATANKRGMKPTGKKATSKRA